MSLVVSMASPVWLGRSDSSEQACCVFCKRFDEVVASSLGDSERHTVENGQEHVHADSKKHTVATHYSGWNEQQLEQQLQEYMDCQKLLGLPQSEDLRRARDYLERRMRLKSTCMMCYSIVCSVPRPPVEWFKKPVLFERYKEDFAGNGSVRKGVEKASALKGLPPSIESSQLRRPSPSGCIPLQGGSREAAIAKEENPWLIEPKAALFCCKYCPAFNSYFSMKVGVNLVRPAPVTLPDVRLHALHPFHLSAMQALGGQETVLLDAIAAYSALERTCQLEGDDISEGQDVMRSAETELRLVRNKKTRNLLREGDGGEEGCDGGEGDAGEWGESMRADEPSYECRTKDY